MEIHQKISVPNCQKLKKTMVKRSKNQKLRLRNFDAGHGRIESEAMAKNRKGLIGVEGGKGICYQWTEKGQCSQGDHCSFRHESNDRAKKPTLNAATPSEPNVSREINSFVTHDHATESRPKDFTSAARESSLWILIRDSLGPPDVMILRTAGRSGTTRKCVENLLLHGSFS